MDHNVPTVITLSFFPMSTAVAILSMCGEQNLKADRPTQSLCAVCGPVFPPQIRFVRAAVCDQASGIVDFELKNRASSTTTPFILFVLH
jgi:hypothetical protein